MSQPSPDARAVVRAADAMTTQLRRIADALTLTYDGPSTTTDDDATTGDDGPRIERPVPLATPCRYCGHPYNWHASSGACEFGTEEIGCGCDTFTVGQRPEPIDPARILGAAAPAADAEQLARWARRESLLVLVTRVQHGRTLTEDEARTLREHVETEMREAETARAVAAGNKRHVQVMYADLQREQRASAGLAAKIREQRTALDAAHRRTEQAEAALARVRALAERWRYTGDRKGSPLSELRAALDSTEQPTTEEQHTP